MNMCLLRENFVHDNSLYPVSVCDLNCSVNKTLMDCHWHDEIEFFFLIEGKVYFQVNSDYFEVNQGQAVLINSGDIHSCYHTDNSRCRYQVLVFHASLLNSNVYDLIQEKYIDPFLKRSYVIPSHLKGTNDWQADILAMLSKIIHVNLAKSTAYELYSKAGLYTILTELYQNHTSEAANINYGTNMFKAERLKIVLNYIHKNYYTTIKLKDLADLVNISESYFCRFFKQMMHKAPMEYLNCYRAHEATRLLSSTDKKILEIAMDVGFDSISNFLNTFKHYLSCTPSTYRKNCSKYFNSPS